MKTKTIIKLFRFIWEFPQCLLGFILTLLYKAKKQEEYKGISIYTTKDFPGGISLGLYILMSELSCKYNTNFIKDHEWGHTRWSLYLGPLYLIIIGLPSIVWTQVYRLVGKDYYVFFPEYLADKSGGVIRK